MSLMLDLGACLLELRFGGGGSGLLALGLLANGSCELPDGAELVLEVGAVCGLGFLLDLANVLEVADCGAGLAELEGEALDVGLMLADDEGESLFGGKLPAAGNAAAVAAIGCRACPFCGWHAVIGAASGAGEPLDGAGCHAGADGAFCDGKRGCQRCHGLPGVHVAGAVIV